MIALFQSLPTSKPALDNKVTKVLTLALRPTKALSGFLLWLASFIPVCCVNVFTFYVYHNRKMVGKALLF
jgi:hypothetical protein